MIISASRRTDLPTYYSEWFFNRLKAGFFEVRNPLNIHQVSRVPLNPEVVDGIVFWTKNPIPMLGKLDLLKDYPYYFQFTVTGYGDDVEPSVPDKDSVIIPAFRKLSEAIGPERVIWRYDPVFLNGKYTMEYHIRRFGEIAAALAGYTEKCVISFVDMYRKTEKNTRELLIWDFPTELQDELAGRFAETAGANGLVVESCAEGIDLEKHGIRHGCCIDARLFERITGIPLKAKKDKSQRPECGCVESRDVGSYNTCRNGCLYCYANYDGDAVRQNCGKYDPNSTMLCDTRTPEDPEDKVTEPKVASLRDDQIKLPI